ncbi:TniQ family protein [Clostridium sp. PL3]|uniref:TniQ family protein n=1 Tax=Clostridium thailandense TaxID=2794346 RepID=A0A949WTL5_9CLOT|nr:TnsD family Tn7-like transposition protein [Clostridium thailandense]MBV7276470.1 TniQ family protein [Clostridium thailandense]
MINCFPKLYKDELLYSAISRYRRMCGLINKEAISRDFIYKQNKIFQILFPFRLNKIAETLPVGSKITGEKLLHEHTMYPFYTKLLSKEVRDEIKENMLNKYDINIFLKLGTGNLIKQRSYLKYCPLCIKADIDELGESYWRREHQYTGVFFCDKHKVQLQESGVICSSINREYVCLDDIQIERQDSIDNKYLDYNLKYIDLVKELVNGEDSQLTLDDIKIFYKDKFYERGLATKSGRIHIKKLAYELKEFYTEEYLNFMDSNIKNYDSNWLMNFFSKNNNKPIVRHLLLLQFLNCQIKDMFEHKESRSYRYEYKVYMPKLDVEERKEEWVKIIEENPNKSRNELININPKVYSYVYKYDREWYEKVTPRYRKKKEATPIDWNKNDLKLLVEAKKAVQQILDKPGKPVKVCNSSIRRELGIGQGIFSKKLTKTKAYISNVTESNENYWKRKIMWAINELRNREEPITIYKVQIKCGFSSNLDKSKEKLIKDILETLN